ncbi:hypothetical protein D3C87_1356790 [compost metagenome]
MSLVEASIFSTSGIPKAAVLPVPVDARPIKSSAPLSRIGKACCWIGVGAVNPMSFIESITRGLMPKDSKESKGTKGDDMGNLSEK